MTTKILNLYRSGDHKSAERARDCGALYTIAVTPATEKYARDIIAAVTHCYGHDDLVIEVEAPLPVLTVAQRFALDLVLTDYDRTQTFATIVDSLRDGSRAHILSARPDYFGHTPTTLASAITDIAARFDRSANDLCRGIALDGVLEDACDDTPQYPHRINLPE